MPEWQNNTNRLKTTPNCNVVQDSIKNVHDSIVLKKTTNCMYDVNILREKSQKDADTNIEDSVRHRAE